MPDPVVIVDYDRHWLDLYAEEKTLILGAIGRWLVAIEHIGSTSVRGLAAKPIIDIMVGVRSLDDAQHCIAPLATVGYVFKPDDTMPARRYFNKGPQSDHHHLHMVEEGGHIWQNQLLFRDYLRAHPETAAEYAALKRGLAGRFGADREGYTEAKTEFIQSVLRAAREV
jgi:GrpB-like predicted nucleotidyltransferase (UPF0157 family)